MRELTKTEEQIMQVIWQLGPSFIKEILAEIPDPKPAYTTVSTMVRILEQKGFVGHRAFGATHQYYALITKDEYSHFSMKKMLENYFDGSLQQMVSFFSKREKLDEKEMDDLLRLVEQLKSKES